MDAHNQELDLRMKVCPKCGAIIPLFDICPHCSTEMIDIGMTLDEFSDLSDVQREDLQTKILAQYAPNLDSAARNKRIAENKQAREERLQRPKCPTCGSYDIRATDAIEAAYAPSIHHSKTVGKSFVCRNCGYAW